MTPQGVPPGANPETGARPGNDIGTGMSLPLGTRASNIDAADTRSQIAPNLPSPQLGPNAGAVDYLRAAQSSLAAGRTGEAQQSLEMAQTRLLDRSVPMGQTNNPNDNPGGDPDLAGAEGAGRGRPQPDHAVDPVGDPGGDGLDAIVACLLHRDRPE